jgi:hypothetical protein
MPDLANEREGILTQWERSAFPSAQLARQQRLRAKAMVERYAHLAPEHLAKAASRLDSLLGGYDLATSEKTEG